MYARQQQTAGNDGGDGEDPRIPLHAQAFLDIERRAATVLAVDFLFVDLAEGRLDEGRAGAEERHHPHPEHRAGAAEGDGGGHAGDVAGAYASGQGHGQGLE